MQDIGYNPESAMLKAYTTAKRAEIGILYLGMRLRNTIWRKNLSMSHSSVKALELNSTMVVMEKLVGAG